MFDTLAILQTEVDRALGHLDRKYLEPEDVTAAAIETLSFYSLDAQHSPFARVSKIFPFSPRARVVAIGGDVSIPSWVERRVGNPPNQSWQFIPAVHPSELSENAGLRCAWERTATGLSLSFNYDPTAWGPYRLHYFSDPAIADTLDSPLGLPTRFGFLFLHATILNVVNSILNRAAQLPADEQLSAAQVDAISAQVAHSQSQIAKWEPLWKTEKDADDAPRGRNRKPVLGVWGAG